jgi:nucleotide-binding universal stress UspA family protein
VDSAAVEGSVGKLAQKYEGVQPEVRVAAGPAAGVLIEASRDAALVVVGARRRHSRAAALLGSVSMAVVERSACSVAVVRPMGPAQR